MSGDCIAGVTATAYTVPTDQPESDGTFEWDSTTIVIAEVVSGEFTGIGYTYSSPAAAIVIREHLEPGVKGCDPLSISDIWCRMIHSVRNIGRAGIASAAISAVDCALWDLKGKLLGLPTVSLLGSVRENVAVYGSGGFTSYSSRQLQTQLAGWVDQGIGSVKMKVGRRPETDAARVAAARKAIGGAPQLFVDANAAYSESEACRQAQAFAESNVTWFEEPVSSENLSGLRSIRECVPDGMDIAAGENGYELGYFHRLLEARSVDVLQADATRCGGITGFLQAAVLCAAYGVPLSAHTAPALHLHPACAVSGLRHLEYFHDHVRIERLFFAGVAELKNGLLAPDLSLPGLGLELKQEDVHKFRSL